MKALITGAHGCLGRHVALCLAESGYVVTGIGHGVWDQDEMSRFGISFWHTADVTVDMLVTYGDEPDVIVHCAGGASVGFSISHPFQDFIRTVLSTAAVLEYIRLKSPRTILVYPSSAAVYGVVNRLPIKESDPIQPASPYGTHKYLAEQLCCSYAASYEISVALIRFFSIYGEGLRKQLLWDTCTKAANAENTFFGTGDELRDWLHVEDAARLVTAAIQHASSACPTFNGGSGQALPVRDIILSVFKEYGTALEPRFTGQPRVGDPPGYQADTMATRDWQWNPSVKWRDGVRRYVDWFKNGAQ